MTTPNVPNLPCAITAWGHIIAGPLIPSDTPATAIPNERMERVKAALREIIGYMRAEAGSHCGSEDKAEEWATTIAARAGLAELGE